MKLNIIITVNYFSRGLVIKVIPNEKYIFNKELFDKMDSEFYSRTMAHGDKWILIIPIVLPFNLNVPEKHMHSILGKVKSVSYIFSTIKIAEPFSLGLLSENNSNIDISKTRVEMILISQNEICNDDESPENCFNEMLYLLNAFLISVSIAQNDSRYYRVTPEMLNLSSMYVHFNTANWDRINEVVGIYILHSNLPTIENTNSECLNESQLSRIDELSYTIFKELNPFVTVQEKILAAKRYYKGGFYSEAVIFAQTSIESLIKTTLEAILDEAFVMREEIDRIDQLSFKSIVQKEMSRYLGGNWDLSSQKDQVGLWYRNTYILRNRVVHKGYFPSKAESSLAMHCAIEMGDFVLKRIKANRKRYPNLQKYFP